MFYTNEQVPVIYPEKSRDFQLLATLLDTYINAVKGYADRIKFQISPAKCEEQFLELLCTRYGFFHKNYLPAAILRRILAVFPEAIRWKGSLRGISTAVQAVLSYYADVYNVGFDVKHYQYNRRREQLIIKAKCYFLENIDITYLQDILRYVVPAGTSVVLEKYYRENPAPDETLNIPL